MACTFVAFILATQALSEPNDSCTEPTESSFLQHRGKLTTAPVGSFTNALMQDTTYWTEACGCNWCHDIYQKTQCDGTAQVVFFVYSQWWIDQAQQLPQHSRWDYDCGGWMLAPENTPRICGGGEANAPAEANALFGKIVSPLSSTFPYKPGGETEAGMIVVAPHPGSYFHFFDIEYFGGQCMVLQAWAQVFTLGNWLGVSDFAFTQKITIPGTGEEEMKWPCMQPSWTDWGGIWPEHWQQEVQMESCRRWHNLREKYGNGKAIPCSQIQVEELYKELSSWDLADYMDGKRVKSCTNEEMCIELLEQDVQKEIEKGLRISYYPQEEAPSKGQWKPETYSCSQSEFAKYLKDYKEMPEDKLSGWKPEV